MKKIFTVITLGSFALVSADQYDQQKTNPSYGQQQANPSYSQQQTNPSYGQQQTYQTTGQQQSSPSYGQQQTNPSYGQQQTNQSYGDQQKSGSQKTVPDQEIYEEIQNELSPGWFSRGFPNVSFDVKNGNVNLRGTVDSTKNKNKIERGVKEIEGVRQVNNQITIAKDS